MNIIDSLDYKFKEIMAHKIILAITMKKLLKEYKDYSVYTIFHEFIEEHISLNTPVHPLIVGGAQEIVQDGKRTTFDVKFYEKLPHSDSKIGIIINLEAQSIRDIKYDIVNRAHYYNARLISTQFKTLADCLSYNDLKKVASIWFVLDPPKYKYNAINRIHNIVEHEIGFVEENLYHVDKSEIIVVYLSERSDDEFIQLLNELRDRTSDLDDFIMKIARKHGIEIDDKIKEEIEQMCNYGQYVKNLGIEEGKAEGLIEGKIEGKAEGLIEGKIEGRLEIIVQTIRHSMNKKNFTFDEALLDSGLTITDEEIIKCKEILFKK